jgi:hypothetical protein
MEDALLLDKHKSDILVTNDHEHGGIVCPLPETCEDKDAETGDDKSFGHYILNQLLLAANRNAKTYPCGNYCQYRMSSSLSLKWSTAGFMSVYFVAELSLGAAIFETFSSSFPRDNANFIANVLAIVFEFGLLAATSISMCIWYYRMKGKRFSLVGTDTAEM